MESQKIINLLNDFDNESSKFTTKNGISFMIKVAWSTGNEMKMIEALNLTQKIANQTFAIIQMQIFL